MSTDVTGTRARDGVCVSRSFWRAFPRQWERERIRRQAFEWAATAFAAEMEKLERLVADIENLEAKAEEAKAPCAPGRMPTM